MFLLFAIGIVFSPTSLYFAYGNTNNTEVILRKYQKLFLAATGNSIKKILFDAG